ncbi:AraC family transcriptional regulator ligand-binding domain-containing protein [Nocardia sp. FBN12]|uniref:AraC family transcriptional regulator n=1 Tax=Nocardia sp. FBN12 TaxID=3419766 RepID=UPI003CFC7302
MPDERTSSAFARAATSLADRKGWEIRRSEPAPETHCEREDPALHAAGLIRELWRVSEDEVFGLGPHAVPRGAFRLLCLGTRSAPDLGSALERFADHAALFAGLPRFALTVAADEARWSADIEHLDDREHLVADATLVFTYRILCWLTGTTLPLRHVEFCYPEPAHVDEYTQIFAAPLAFDCAQTALTFDSSVLTAPIAKCESALLDLLHRAPVDLLVPDHPSTPIADRVRQIIATDLSRKGPSADEIAGILRMSEPTLRRKLRAEQTTISDIRDDMLHAAAIAGLVHGDETVAELSSRLGFSEPSAFNRAFRRWTGCSPRSYPAESATISGYSKS